MIKVHIWYDDTGEILAVGTLPEQQLLPNLEVDARRRQAAPVAHSNQRVIEVSLVATELERLHETHCMDTRNGTLVPRGMNIP